MKHLFLIFSFAFFTTPSFSQMSDTSLLIGSIKPEQLRGYSWYQQQFDAYQPDSIQIADLKLTASNIRIMVVLGTWCGDSKEHLPALFKIAQQAGIRDTQIELIGVDRKKKCPLPDISSLNIEYVPTFFVFNRGVLKGKIVETPATTLEQDILQLLQK